MSKFSPKWDIFCILRLKAIKKQMSHVKAETEEEKDDVKELGQDLLRRNEQLAQVRISIFVWKKNVLEIFIFLSKNSTLISEENCWFFGWKTRENVVVLDFLAVDNFDFTRKIVQKIGMKNSWNVGVLSKIRQIPTVK